MEPKPGRTASRSTGVTSGNRSTTKATSGKLYAFALVEMMGTAGCSIWSSPPQPKFRDLCSVVHVHAFQMLNGIARELWYGQPGHRRC